MRRRLAAGAMLVGTTAGLWLLLAPATGHAQEPDISAWWNAANAGDPAPAPPPPPDVPDGDLLVQGSNAGVPATPLGAAPATAQAVAGLRFDLQPTDVVGALRLVVDGDPPPQVSVVACRAAETFGSASNGSWSKVPAYDGDACVDGKLDDDAVVFADAAELVADARLSVVILPGALDRVVFEQPGADTLEVTHAGAVGGKAPAFGAGAQSSDVPPAGGSDAAAPPQGPVGGTDVVPPPTSDLPSSGAVDAPAAEQPPVVAGSTTADTVGVRPAAAAADEGLSTGQRRAIALVVIAAEVVGYALLSRTSDASVAPAAVAGGMASGRLRPPDRAVGGLGPASRSAGAVPGGVGRFRRDREGPAPQL
jgi:hypothetical protein